MNREPNSLFASSLWLPLLLLTCGIGLRVVKLQMGAADCCPNIAPWMALAFTGAFVFPRALPWWVWPVAMLGADMLVQGSQTWANLRGMGLVYVCWALAAVWGGALRSRTGALGALASVVACSLGFYLITNTQAWLASPDYAKTLAGWAQALTTGLPGYPPTILFLRNSLLSDLGFSALLLIAYNAEALLRSFEKIPWVRRERIAA